MARFTDALSPEHMSTGIARIKLGHTMVKQEKWSPGAVECRAGYDILVKQKAQQQVWLEMARQDLGTAYTALGDSADASRFNAELALMHEQRAKN